MRLAWAFFKRDALIALSYRAAFGAQLIGNVVLLGFFYFIGQLMGTASAHPALAPYGGSYLAFLLIGVALADCVGVSLTTFAGQIREGQLTGTLEATLMSPVKLPTILIWSSLWNYFFTAIQFGMYLVLGAVFYDVSMGQANVPAALVIFVLTVVCFAGVGIFWASIVMLIKRGDQALKIASLGAILVSGVLFPTTMLPEWLQQAAALVPLTHALEGMRHALLRGDSFVALQPVLWKLTAFAIALVALGLVAFDRAVVLTKRTGSLVEY